MELRNPSIFFLFLVLFCPHSSGQESTTHGPNSEEARYYNQLCTKDLEATEHFVTYTTRNFGCVAICSILTSSSSGQFLDQSLQREHLIHGKVCINDTYVCLNGTCVINPLKVDPQAISLVPSLLGQDGNRDQHRPVVIPISGSHGTARITIHNGYVRHDDNPFSKGDIYIKVFVNSRSVGTTRTILNTHHPSFEQVFIIDSLTRMDVLKFEVWDSDTENDDYLGSVATTCDEIFAKRMNNKRKTHYWSTNGALASNRIAMTINCESF